jgi:hypothetical protein
MKAIRPLWVGLYPSKEVEVLTPCTYKCDLLWKWSLMMRKAR